MKNSPASHHYSLSRVLLRSAEFLCWIFGIALLGYFAQMTWGQRWQAQRDVERFMSAAASAADVETNAAVLPTPAAPDQRLWSSARRAAYLASLEMESPAPVAILRVPSVGIEVPVYLGTSGAVLDRGAGWIEGTARVGDEGNIGIAAHRDSYFRSLANIRQGALVELRTPAQLRRFRISYTRIVAPSDTSPIHLTEENALTLVTCYPFYFVGHAPERFIVRAVAIDAADARATRVASVHR